MTDWVFTTPPSVVRQLAANLDFENGGDLGAYLDGIPAAERERLLNEADLPGQARRQQESFQAWAGSTGYLERDLNGDAWQVCGHENCTEIPRDENGMPVKSPLRQWWCALHASEATPEDNQQWQPPLGFDPAGCLVDLEAQAREAAQAQRDARRLEERRAVERAEREAEAELLGPDDEDPYWQPSGPGWTS